MGTAVTLPEAVTDGNTTVMPDAKVTVTGEPTGADVASPGPEGTDVLRSLTKMSRRPLVSPGTRLVASDAKAT